MNIREIAVKTLVSIDQRQAFSNLTLNKLIRKFDINKKDADLLRTLVYGTLQHKITIDHILKKFIKRDFDKLDLPIKEILRLAVYQILFLTRIPEYAIVNEAVKEAKEIDKYKSGMVNGVIRNVIRNKKAILKTLNDTNNLEIKYSIPGWIISKYKETYGENAEKILSKINDTPDLFIRVKPDNYDEVFSELTRLGAEPKKDDDLGRNGMIIGKPERLSGLADSHLYKNGLITVQDKGAILVSLALDPKKGDKVLDICAAPGGKTTHLAELLEGTGEVDALDVHPGRTELVKNASRRLKLDNVKAETQDATIFNPDMVDKYDKILVDVPCSGLGVLRRKPEIRYNIKEKDIKNLEEIQQSILKNAISYLKPGGELVYSTCTVNPDENTKLVESVVKNTDDVEIIREEQTSFLDNSDGFYYALLKKE